MTQIFDGLGAPSLTATFYGAHHFTVAQFNASSIGLSPDKFVPGLLSAVVLLVVGIILAIIAKGITAGLLKRTGLGQQLSRLVSSPSSSGISPTQIERGIASLIFWFIIIFTLVAALQSLQLTAVSVPLQGFLNKITEFLPPLAGALLLAGIAWVLATVVKLIVVRALQAFGLDERLQQLSSASSTAQPAISQTIGNILYALILLLFLPPILNALGLTDSAQPILALINQGFAVLLNVIGAGVIGLIGWFIARFVGRLVTSLLAGTRVDQLGERMGLNPSAGGQSLSQVAGTITYVAILIPIAIAALQVLKIEAISAPAIAMLNQILGALPKIFTAAVILAIAFLAGKFVGHLVTSLLSGIGFNNIFTLLGLPTRSAAEEPSSVRSPSEIAGMVVLGGVVLFGVVTATDVLGLPALTAIVQSLIQILGQILSGLIVFAVGLYLANLAFNLIASSGSGQAQVLGHSARIAIIILIAAMALRQIGVATDIVNLAFGLLLGAIAVAIALAFGLGGRDIAAEQVREWLTSFKQAPSAPAPAPTPPSTPSPAVAAPSAAAPPDPWPSEDEDDLFS
jgi:Conserved TM helix